MSHYTVVNGKNDLVGVYCDGKLHATHDKHTKHNGDLARYTAKLLAEGHEVSEEDGNFARFADIPQEIDEPRASCDKSDPADPSQVENAQQALQGTMKGRGTIHRKEK